MEQKSVTQSWIKTENRETGDFIKTTSEIFKILLYLYVINQISKSVVDHIMLGQQITKFQLKFDFFINLL